MTKLDVAEKRDVLHSVSKIFDPLGLFSPVTFYGKVFLQKLWALNITWNEPLSTTLLMEWNQIVQQLSEISEFRIPRLVGDAQETDYQLLIFCDASVKAYAAVVYLRFKDGTNFQTNLLFAKMRLVPVGRKSSLKHLTIPRLELLAMLIGVRVANFIVKELRIKISERILWSDSQCVLHWLKTSKPLSVFVENRIREICMEKDITFRYIASNQNPQT